MAYIYEVSFDIGPEQMTELQIGASLERVLGYLRTLLPGQVGYMYTRAMYSVGEQDKTLIVAQSAWETWEDLERHRNSSLSEEKVIVEFGEHVNRDGLDICVFQEID
jgi:hypothetical protein